MTREEAIKGLDSFKATAMWNGSTRLYSALCLAISALREQPRWISVEERLPEPLESVIVWTRWGEMGEALLDGKHFVWMGDTDIAAATHWMPLPEPPSED